MTFSKEERITSRKAIETLLKKGKRNQVDFIQVNSILFKEIRHPQVKVLFSVPKRKFAKAVDRNLLKRRLREAYRKNKASLFEKCEKDNISYDLMFIYNADSIKTYAEIEHKIVLFLGGLMAINEINS